MKRDKQISSTIEWVYALHVRFHETDKEFSQECRKFLTKLREKQKRLEQK